MSRHRRADHTRGVVALCGAGAAALLAAVGFAGTTGTTHAPATAATALAAPADGDTAAAVLATLPVRPADNDPAYDREAFNHWTDTDRDGCDARAEILERDAEPGTAVRDGDGCVVGATITDPYTGDQVTEQPGRGSDVDIDHIVALADAWRSGAQALDEDERERLANNPANLVASHDVINREKSDHNAAAWMPPRADYRCLYVAAQIAVKDAYHLSVTAAEHAAMTAALDDCPGQPIPGVEP